jgi:hypothetical protein
VIFGLLGCAVAAPAAAPAPSPEPPPAAPADAAPPDCAALLRDLAGQWRQSQLAASPAAAARAFHAGWPAVPPACRDGEWYLLAARDLGRTPTRELSTPDGVRLRTSREALERALQVDPADAAVVAFLAFGAGVGADLPAVPPDACGTLAPSDDQRYVCGVGALAAGRPADAVRAFAAIADPTPYPDIGLRWYQAAVAAGVPVTLPPAVDHPPTDATCFGFGATPDECGRIQAAWRRLPPRR